MSTTETTLPDQVSTTGASTAWMSWLRVLAIFSVVAIHTVGFNAIEPGARENLLGQVALLLNRGSLYAVPVFVMLSGALMLDPARYQGPATFLRKRALRLVPPLLFWHLWYAVFIREVLGRDLPFRAIVQHALNGNLYTALYFFWIILGLSLFAPVLIPFVREQGARGATIAGFAISAVPVLVLATSELRDTGVGMSETAFTWWIPYLGLFLLGYGLRQVVLRGALLWLAVAGAAALAFLNAWQWRNPDAPGLLQELTPVGYYSFTGIAFAVLVYLAFHGLLAPEGPLRFAARPAGVRIGRLLGDATLGVFALHLTVLYYVQQAGIGGPGLASPTGVEMLFRLGVVLAITWAIVLVLRKVPVVRAVL